MSKTAAHTFFHILTHITQVTFYYYLFHTAASTSTTVTAFVLSKNKNATMMDEEPILLQGHHLLLEVPNTHSNIIYVNLRYNRAKEFGKLFLEQLHSRNLLFDKLLNEFSNLIGFSNKKIIQQAAAIQALCSTNLTTGNKHQINFSCFPSTALWYQQEILSLVMRVYCEDQWMDDLKRYIPSAINDADKCKKDLQGNTPAPSTYRQNVFKKLVHFLVDGLKENDYKIQGPVLKPLQSLFNKMFIRRGQISVSVIGDMTRATLLVKDEEDLRGVVTKIEDAFPDINGGKFQGPNKIGMVKFLEEVAEMKKVPGSEIILYRFKPNSSQKERMSTGDPPLYFNLNFFDGIPEYHRVGSTEMFVAFELQIGLEAEVNGLRKNHLSYEEGRILTAQPLLKTYKESQEKSNEVDASTASAPSFLTEDHDDFKLISSVLEGNFANWKHRELGKKVIAGDGTASIAPEKLCLNNKRLNIWANQDKAVVLDGPFKLDPSKMYSVDSVSLKIAMRISGISVGLFAFFGPYMVQISALLLGNRRKEEGISLVKQGVNFLTMEGISMLPSHCDRVILVAWGEPFYWNNRNGRNKITLTELKESDYHGMKLVLNQYEELTE